MIGARPLLTYLIECEITISPAQSWSHQGGKPRSQETKMTNSILITGNTFAVKEQIKALGGRWDAESKGWKVPAARAEEARKLVIGGGAKTAPRRENFRRYGWDGKYNSPSYYSSGAYDAE